MMISISLSLGSLGVLGAAGVPVGAFQFDDGSYFQFDDGTYLELGA